MLWYELYEMTFGSDISGKYKLFEEYFKKQIPELDGSEIFQSIRDLKNGDTHDLKYVRFGPPASDLTLKILMNRQRDAVRARSGEDSPREFIQFMKNKIDLATSDVEIYNGVCSPMHFWEGCRECTVLEIEHLFAYAKETRAFHEELAEAEIVKERGPAMKEFKDRCDELAQKWIIEDPNMMEVKT